MPAASLSDAPSAPAIQGLHHFAWKCRDAEETRHFYEDILGLPLVHVIRSDVVPSTGEHCPYVHVFFQLGDGSSVAFFDLGDDTKAEPSPNTPPWVNHLALQVADTDALARARDRLLAAGIDVIGPTDHHFVESIYMFDPNGIRLELTAPKASAQYLQDAQQQAHALCAQWTAEKHARRAHPAPSR